MLSYRSYAFFGNKNESIHFVLPSVFTNFAENFYSYETKIAYSLHDCGCGILDECPVRQ